MYIESFVRVQFPQIFFYTVAEVSSLGFYSGPYYLFGINRIACKE
mgnify:CR=1 FL=1